MQLIIGQFLGTTDRPREWEGRRWTETIAHVLDGVRSIDVTLFGGTQDGTQPPFDKAKLPGKGDTVALEVYGRGGGNKRVYYTATDVVTDDKLAEAMGLVSI